jgi:CHAT domain-containing protein/tetratricopeptide (TPR) repeat protein
VKPADEAVDGALRWVQLLDGSSSDEVWIAFDAEPESIRTAVVKELKSKVDGLCRNAPPQALPLAESLVRSARDLPELLPLALRGRGAAAHFNGQEDQALQDFERSAQLYTDQGLPVESARALRSLVDVHQMVGRTDEALSCAHRAEEIFAAHGEQRLLAQLHLNVGNVYTRIDDYTAADQFYSSARESFEQLEDELGLAFCDFNLAVVAMNANRCDDAESSWRAARSGMDRAGMGMLVADCDYNLAYLESRRGRFERAIEGLGRAREAYRENGKPSGPPLCDLDLAEIQLRLGMLRDARRHAAEAAESFEKLDMLYEFARAEVLGGIACARLGDASAAMQLLTSAEERFHQQGNVSLAAFVALQKAQIELRRGHGAAVIEDLVRSRKALLDKGMIWLGDLAALTLCRALIGEGRSDEALAELAQVVDERPEGSTMDGLLAAIALRLRADALAESGDQKGALDSLQEAVSTIDATWSQVPSGDVRIAFFRDQHPAFVDLTFLLLDAGRTDDALQIFEHGRSRSLLESSPLVRDPAWTEARERLDWLLARQLDTELGPLAGGTELRPERELGVGWTQQITVARQQLADLSSRDQRQSSQDLPARIDSHELLAARQRDELLLVYLLGPKGVRVLVIDDDGHGKFSIDAVDLHQSEVKIIAQRDRLLFQLARRGVEGASSRGLHAALAALGQRLLHPIADRLVGPNGPRPIVVVPYGVLHDLPVHAFEFDGAPLAATHQVSQAISVWHLARLRSQRRVQPAQTLGWCVGASLGALPAIDREIADLASIFGDSLQHLSPDALLKALHAGSLSGRLLHIASHGRFERERPRFSAICLGEHFLLAHDVAAMTLDVDLVTLSGCETGRKRTTGGDELMGLPRALLGAGAKSVLGSLWPVRDDTTARFMHDFYASFATGRSARESLALARRSMLNETDDPVSWAAFSLLGDPDVSLVPADLVPLRAG